MSLGFAISNNLSESRGTTDESILSNLAFPGIANSLRLFANNSNRLSSLNPGEYEVENGLIHVNQIAKTGFSNRTVITIDESEYVVFDSNGLNKFRLRKRDTGSIHVPNATTDVLVRNDSITFQNLTNLDVVRFQTNVDDTNFLNSLYNRNSISRNLNLINDAFDSFSLIKTRVPITTEDAEFNQNIRFNGVVRIKNNENISLTDPNAPGLFILSNEGEALKAFSNSYDPWIAINQTLKTEASKATIKKVIFENSNLNIEGVSTEVLSVPKSVNDFTHKLPVTIDGEAYFLLLKE